MELIIGGRCQGKLAYALNLYGLTRDSVCTGRLEPKPVIYNLHIYIKEALSEGRDPEAEVLSFAESHPDTVFICDRLGCGLVPLKQEDREWRDKTGRICCLLAARAQRVHRVIAGIGQVIKG